MCHGDFHEDFERCTCGIGVLAMNRNSTGISVQLSVFFYIENWWTSPVPVEKKQGEQEFHKSCSFYA
jgi:hypothetical protein